MQLGIFKRTFLTRTPFYFLKVDVYAVIANSHSIPDGQDPFWHLVSSGMPINGVRQPYESWPTASAAS